MRLIGVVALALLAACASAARGGTGLEGSYALQAVNGQTIPAESGDEDGVILHGGTLTLEPGGRYALQMLAAARGQPSPQTARIGGSYRVSGDSLALFPEPASQGGEAHFRYVVTGRALRLRDDDGDEYTFLRQ